jgi:23S rRNA (cytidine2498-2'-O)-methyltransferase
MHFILTDPASEPLLIQELQRASLTGHHEIFAPELVASDLALQADCAPTLVFARQFLPDAALIEALSISAWSQALFAAAKARLPESGPWQLHVAPHYGSGEAGLNRCHLIRQSLHELLRRKCRRLLRSFVSAPAPFTPETSLVQLLLLSPDRGLLSVAARPRPSELRRIVSPFPKGAVAVPSDKAAPSRAFAKLLEVEQRLGCRISAGETCVDLGAAPGSWSYVALRRGGRVIAVDRAPLRADLMRHPRLVFHQGDAFKFKPESPVDWLLCDVIAEPSRSIELLMDWLRHGHARQFVVSIKFKGRERYELLEDLKQLLPSLCREFFLMRLCANKNEVCAFGHDCDMREKQA